MQNQISQILDDFNSELLNAANSAEIESLKVHYLGRKGPIQQLMQELRHANAEERPHLGQSINVLKEKIEKALVGKLTALVEEEEAERLTNEKVDVTLPGRQRFIGRKHIITQTLHQMIQILSEMGFTVQYGPDIDSDYYNYEALNFPPDHPARDMQDTFYITPKILLRSHTSNIQARVMEMHRPPIRIIAPGKAYRNEAISNRSHVFFHQVEAVYIDDSVTFSDLLSTMDQFLKRFFGQDVAVRYRPSYFPFVEPGMEVDVSCLKCQGNGCDICKHSGWLEVAGAGMIHPEVLKNGGIDPEKYSGFAWGMGVERPAMLKHGIDDIRLFTENDMRFLSQFPG